MDETNAQQDLQTVYVLTNPAMPGIVKIGMTHAFDAGERIASLGRNSAVPLPFDCVYACNVSDAKKVGDVITFRDGVTTATIAGPHTVIYQGDESALQPVSLKLMPEIVGRGVASKFYWSINGQSLADLYEAFHGDEE